MYAAGAFSRFPLLPPLQSSISIRCVITMPEFIIFGRFTLWGVAADNADDVLPERLHKFTLILHHAVDGRHYCLMKGVLFDGRRVFTLLGAVFQAVVAVPHRPFLPVFWPYLSSDSAQTQMSDSAYLELYFPLTGSSFFWRLADRWRFVLPFPPAPGGTAPLGWWLHNCPQCNTVGLFHSLSPFSWSGSLQYRFSTAAHHPCIFR